MYNTIFIEESAEILKSRSIMTFEFLEKNQNKTCSLKNEKYATIFLRDLGDITVVGCHRYTRRTLGVKKTGKKRHRELPV